MLKTSRRSAHRRGLGLLCLGVLTAGILAATACSPEAPRVAVVAAAEVTPTPTPESTPVPVLIPDPAPPAGTLSIDAGAASFTDPALNLSIAVTAGSPTEMRFSFDGGSTWTAWTAFAASASLTLPPDITFGPLTVTAQLRDASGLIGLATDAATYTSANRASMSLKTSYLFKTSLNYDTAKITTTETLTLTNTSGGLLSQLNLSVPPKAFGEFALGAVKVDGRTVTPSWTNNANLLVPLARNVRVGEQAVVTIAFTDTATSSISTSLQARLSKANGIMQVSQWFPIVSDGHALRYPGDSQYTLAADSFRLELSLNRAMGVAAPGTVSAPTSLTRVVTFGPGRDFAFSVSPDYRSASGVTDGVTVRVYYRSGTAGSTALANARAALHEYNARFGAYPYKTFVVAQATRPGAGNEYPGIIFVGSSNLGSKNVVRHETAHQWFYGLLGDDQIRAPWLDEAFAQWAGNGYVANRYCSTKKVSSPITAFPNTAANYTSGTCGSYDQTVYFKGSAFIVGVRSRMGATAFDNAMRNLVAKHRFGVITTKMVAENWLAYTASSKRASLTTYMKAYISW